MNQKQKTQKLLLEFSEKIRKYRWDYRMSTEALAKKAGVSMPTLTALEKNELTNTSIRKIMCIGDALGIQISLQLKDLKKALPKEFSTLESSLND